MALPDHLQLFRAVMVDCGEAAQTFAAVKRLSRLNDREYETFASVDRIRKISRLPRRTTQAHLRKLCHYEWLENIGRQRRRTPTYCLNLPRLVRKPHFAVLPTAFAAPEGLFRAWSARAILAAVISQDLLQQHIESQNPGHEGGGLDYRGVLKVAAICRITGLTEKTVRSTVQLLAEQDLFAIFRDQVAIEVGLNRDALERDARVTAA